MVNKEKEAMLKRLHDELTRKDTTTLITPDEYTAIREIANFGCPNGWNLVGCDGSNCPRQPDPCDRCDVTRLLDRARARHGVIPDDVFRKTTKRCNTCDEKTRWMGEPTYYEKCMGARRANGVLQEVTAGKVVVVSNGNGWAIPV